MSTLTGELAKVVSTKDIPEIEQEIKNALVSDNLKSLSPEKKVELLEALCKSVGLNPLSQPFIFMEVKERKDAPLKHKIYATRDCTEQLRKIYGVSAKKTGTQQNKEIYMVDVEVSDNSGRVDFGTGVVAISSKQYGAFTGEYLANAIMRCETKAKRRATLSICGLGFLDEVETDTHDAKPLGGNSEPSELPNTPQQEPQKPATAAAEVKDKKDPPISELAKLRKEVLEHIPPGEMPTFSNFLEFLTGTLMKINPPISELVNLPNMGAYSRVLLAVRDARHGHNKDQTEYQLWKQSQPQPKEEKKEEKQEDPSCITLKQAKELFSKLTDKDEVPLFKEFLAYVSREVWEDNPPIQNTSEIKAANFGYMVQALEKGPDGEPSGFDMWVEQRRREQS